MTTLKPARSPRLSVAVATGVFIVLFFSASTSLFAQVPAAQSAAVPQWQIDAGGKMEFEVASVKPNTTALSPATMHSNIPLGPQDLFAPTGGLLSVTNYPLALYIIFAYKIAPDQTQAVLAQLPKWANADHYDIQARAPGNPTKDQFRLMMQALLADRFKLAVHYETKQVPVFALVLDKPGKLGAHLQRHPADAPCSTAPLPPGTNPASMPTVAGGFPEPCGGIVGWPSATAPGRLVFGARNTPISMIASSINNALTGIDRPVLDKTELIGTYDFVVEFAPQFNGPLPPGATFEPDPNGPTFIEALKEQLGLKLEAQTGSVNVLVIDHVEEPSEN